MNIFTYGSLMFPDVIENIVKQKYSSQNVFVKNIKRSKIVGDVYPVALQYTNAPALEGRVYFNVNRQDVTRLDRFEGEYYFRKEIPIYEDAALTKLMGKADIYLLKPKYRRLFSKTLWSPEEFRAKQMSRFNSRYPSRHA